MGTKPIDKISAFFPAYNEEGNIAKCIENAKKALEKYATEWEIILVVYEESTDSTREIVKEYQKKDPRIKLVIQPKERKGVGAAYHIGFEAAQYDKVFYADSDNQFDIGEISKFLPYMNNYDIVAGKRMNRQDPIGRKFASNVYNLMLRSIFQIDIEDLDCGFRFVNKRIFNKVKINASTGLMTAETIIKALKHGYKVKQVPVSHYARETGVTRFSTPLANIPKPKIVWEIIQEIIRLKKEVKKIKAYKE